MLLTGFFSRIALLDGGVLNKLITKYNLTSLKVPSGVEGWAKGLNNVVHDRLPGKEDLVTEWVLKSVSEGTGRADDVYRFIEAAQFYFNHYKSDRFKVEVKKLADKAGKSVNPKNLLDFTLPFMDDLEEVLQRAEVDPRVYQLAGNLPQGSKLIYNDGEYQVVEVTSPEAACELGRGTKWCTSNEGVAKRYLDSSPLYVVYFNGRKMAQLHIDFNVQLMDLRDRPLKSIPDGLRRALKKLGLFKGALEYIDEYLEDEVLIPILSEQLVVLIGDRPSLKVVSFIATRAGISFLYAYGPLGRQRFPQGEKVIANDAWISLCYAKYIIKGRWKPGEAKIIQSGNWIDEYKQFIGEMGQLGEFMRDHPEIESLQGVS